MSVADAEAVTRDAGLLSKGAGVIAVLAVLARRWVLLVLALLLLGVDWLFLQGSITTR